MMVEATAAFDIPSSTTSSFISRQLTSSYGVIEGQSTASTKYENDNCKEISRAVSISIVVVNLISRDIKVEGDVASNSKSLAVMEISFWYLRALSKRAVTSTIEPSGGRNGSCIAPREIRLAAPSARTQFCSSNSGLG